MHAGLLAGDGCVSSALTALIGVLSTAQAQRPGAGPAIPLIRVDVTGTGRTVTTRAGLTVPVTMHPREPPAVEVVVAPALATMTAADTLSALAARATRGDHQGRRHITDEELPPALRLSGAPDEWLRHAAHRHDRRRQADPPDRRPSGSMPSRRTGSAERRVRAATTGSTRGRE